MIQASISGSMNVVGKRKAAEVHSFIEVYLARKEEQIAEIMQVIERYEKKRMAEERAYQTMSPIRRMISGRKPDHHLAVEYIHYVKKPLEQVSRLRKEVEQARAVLEEAAQEGWVNLPDDLEKEMN